MEGRATQFRTVALLALLLCIFGLIAPVAARADGSTRHPALHGIRAATTTTADHHASLHRLDLPHASLSHSDADESGPALTAAPSAQTFSTITVDSARTRGPPAKAYS